MLQLRKNIAISALAFIGTISTTATYADVTANIAASSNYLWRGQEQNGGDAAISGGIDYTHDSGFYAGTWTSNASWADDMTYELDLYAGFAGNFSQSVSYDVGYIYYTYPDAASSADTDLSEVYGNISVVGITFGAAVLATAAGSGDNTDFGDSLYLNVDYSFPVGSNGTEFTLHAGRYSGSYIGDTVIDYGASVSNSGFTFGLSNTDIAGTDLKVYLSYTKSFDL